LLFNSRNSIILFLLKGQTFTAVVNNLMERKKKEVNVSSYDFMPSKLLQKKLYSSQNMESQFLSFKVFNKFKMYKNTSS
jgi:hypoxanthine-guanine phosphoribosyltransferase